ncbi:MAG TPA: DNA polymerase ligase N-terminal domain-containing protein [Pirellulales bacterium]|jgi:hypothetical protein|nr:DNA polymerase ligase N-terminal domain-containing protein [Pirellulales bacterium]
MRFVVLRHEMPAESPRASHWDFMLEIEGRLRTWALSAKPQASVTVEAERLADHRIEYLDIEGPIAGNHGSVTRVDCGRYTTLAETETDWRLTLEGDVLRGGLHIEQVDGQRWTFTFDDG